MTEYQDWKGEIMKLSLKRTAYMIYFVALALTFAVIYYGSYYYGLKYMTSENIITKEKIQEDNPAVDYTNSGDNLNEVNANMNLVITSKTDYIEESYNIDTEELSKNTIVAPIEVLGYNREQLIDYLTTYMTKNTDETLVNIQLVSFSAETVVVRKTIRKVEKNYSYYVKASEDGELSIYKADKITKYFDTGIMLNEVEEDEREKLKEGYFIEDIHELYNFLESITS